MSALLSRQPRRPLTRATARNCALINQLGTPGLGSLLGRRYVAGAGQLLLAVAGFGLVIAWFILLVLQLYRQVKDGAEGKSVAWVGEAGVVGFAAAWLWALVTSLSLLREARANEVRS